MPAYDATRFDPPAPLALVTLRNPDSAITLPDVPMLLDTGADATLVPQPTIRLLGLANTQDKFYELSGFNGSKSLAAVVRLDLLFLGRVFRGQFLLIDQEYGILGRNVLNSISLLLDGPDL
ncbi:MAG TPA: aspartyl protease family protein, partial [Roseiflexaceae bacterium]